MYSDKHVPLEDQEQTASASSQNDTAARKPRRAPDKFNRFAWRKSVFADPKTPANVARLAFGIAEFVNGETGDATPSTITLAEVCGFSEKTVRKMIPLLQAAGWIEVQYGSKGRGPDHCNHYSINLEKRTPCPVLAETEKRTVKWDFSRLKPDPVSEEPLNHKEEEVRFKNRKRAGPQAAPRPPACWSQSIPNSAVTAADDESQNPASNTDIPDTKSAPVRRLVSSRVEVEEPTETQPLEALASTLLVWPVANAANGGTLIDLAGQAARRPEQIRPHQRGTTMAIPKPEPREVTFARLLRWYPPEFIGGDDQLNFEAYELALDHGLTVQQLQAEAILQFSEACEGKEVPLLAEWLVAQCWDERIAA